MINYYYSIVDHTRKTKIEYYVVLYPDDKTVWVTEAGIRNDGKISEEREAYLWSQVSKLVARKLYGQDTFPSDCVTKKLKKQTKVTYSDQGINGSLVRCKDFSMYTSKYNRGDKPHNKAVILDYRKERHSCIYTQTNGKLVPAQVQPCEQIGGNAYQSLKKKKTHLMLF